MPTKVTVRIPDEVYRVIAERAKAEDVPVSTYCLAAVEHAAKRLKCLRVNPPLFGLAAADEETRAAVASMGGQAGGRSRSKKS